MPYDEARNVEIGRLVAFDDEKQQLSVAVSRYDGGAPKIQVDRFRKKGGVLEWKKLGRMTLDEFNKINACVRVLEEKGAFR